ncbi:MAG: MFS transporter [Oscillospiraceae bacterium]|jgi:Na+/melibiose symporter-like transporter|nr:MFS transporter [Oscillospiraceae bacterium]
MAKQRSAPEVGGLKTYTKFESRMYMTGMFGQNIIYNVANMAFTAYFISNLQLIPASIVGVILAVAQVWDAFNDPIMGTIVDRTRSRWGKCRPYLLFVPSIVLVVTMLCFLGGVYDHSEGASALHNAGVVLWAGGFYICWGMSYTAGDIPLWGVSSLITEVEKHRKQLQANLRIAAGIGTAIVVLGFQPLALKLKEILLHGETDPAIMLNMERKAYIIMALVFTVIGCVTFQMAGIFTREKIPPSGKVNKVGENFKMMWRNKPFRQLLISGVLAAPRNLTMLVAITMVSFYFANKDPGKALMYIALIGGGLFLGMFGTTVLVPKLSDRFAKKTLYNASCLVEIIPNLSIMALFLISTRVEGGLTALPLLIPLMVMFAIKGVCLGLYMAVQTNMIADAVDYEDYHNHIRPDGVFYSGQTFMTKIGNGISTIIYTSLCALVGYSGENVQALQALIDDPAVKQAPRDLMARGVMAPVYDKILNDPITGKVLHLSLSPDQLYWFFFIMFFAVSIIPAVGNLLAVIPTWKYALDPAAYQEILAELQARRREAGQAAE